MTKLPLIGITVESVHDPKKEKSHGSVTLNWNYFEQVTLAGGLPIIIPPTADAEQVADLIDGWLIPGGSDIDASRFGQRNHPKAEVQDPSRFEIEKELYRFAPFGMPILGICYGCQFLNVIEGGDLIQHLPDREGTFVHTGGSLQTYQLQSDSLAAQALASRVVEGKSFHHQAIGAPGKNIHVTGIAEDGVVEALEVISRKWSVGVQWHPERTPNSAESSRLFRTFIEEARAYSLAKSDLAAQ